MIAGALAAVAIASFYFSLSDHEPMGVPFALHGLGVLSAIGAVLSPIFT